MDAESKERGRDYLAAHVFLTTARLGRARGNRPATQGNGAAREEGSCARNGALACKESGRSLNCCGPGMHQWPRQADNFTRVRHETSRKGAVSCPRDRASCRRGRQYAFVLQLRIAWGS